MTGLDDDGAAGEVLERVGHEELAEHVFDDRWPLVVQAQDDDSGVLTRWMRRMSPNPRSRVINKRPYCFDTSGMVVPWLPERPSLTTVVTSWP